jgi:4-amino-4-deoxy-L-arabinose transferase-like glycosyltransferase
MPLTRTAGLTIVALAAVVLLPNLGGSPLWDDDEPRNAACSLAMHASGDWIVPTFNGRVRVEKPVLVNWLQLVGFAIAGVNETGARLASAVLTMATCLLTGLIAGRIFRPDVGLWAGIVMATCLWTGVGGRAATPDAALVFCTTLALWTFVRGTCRPTADGTGWRDGPVVISWPTAAGVGAACGLAVLAKGPIGLVLPLAALGLFCWWQAWLDPGRVGPLAARLASTTAACMRGLRPLIVSTAAVAVAAPWYAAVTIRTDGEWLRSFLLVHNLGRFIAPMEGHAGSPLVYFPAVILLGTFPWSMASALVAGHAARAARDAVGMRLAVCWIAAWVVPLSLSGTKLPGYVWPIYPAVAIAAGHFLADWIRRPAATTDRWMRVAWMFLAASGLALAIGLPLVTRRIAPGAEWLGLIGLVPVVGAAAAWACQSLSSRIAAASVWAATACGTVGLLLAIGPAAVGHVGGTRDLMAGLRRHPDQAVPIATFKAPASAVFYAGLVAPCGAVAELAAPAAAAEFVAEHPQAHLVVDARFEAEVQAALPPEYGVLRTASSFPSARRMLLVGPKDAARPARLATEPAPAPSRH